MSSNSVVGNWRLSKHPRKPKNGSRVLVWSKDSAFFAADVLHEGDKVILSNASMMMDWDPDRYTHWAYVNRPETNNG